MTTQDRQAIEVQAGLSDVIKGFEKTLKIVNDCIYTTKLIGKNPEHEDCLQSIANLLTKWIEASKKIKVQVDEMVGTENE